MKFIDILSRAGRNLRQAKIRTILTSFAIAVGAFAITLSSMAGEGARQYVTRILDSNVNPAAIFISAKTGEDVQASYSATQIREYNEDETYGSYQGYSQKMLDEKDLKKLTQRDDIKQVEPYYMVTSKYVQFSNIEGKKFVVNIELQDYNKATKVSDGRNFEVGEKLAKDEVILPDSFLDSLGKKSSEMIGQTIKITLEQAPNYGQDEIYQAVASGDYQAVEKMTKVKTLEKEVKIVGVSKKTPEQQVAPSALVIGLELARELHNFSTEGTPLEGKYYAVTALVNDMSKVDEVKESIVNEGYSVVTAKDAQNMIMTFVNVLQGIVTGFGLLALMVSVFGIINTMYISVLERTQQIGLMKALGASRRDIGRLFRLEAAWVGFLGAILGVGLALIAGMIANPVISDYLDVTNNLLVAVPVQIAIIVAVIVLISILSGWLPSRKAAKLDPIEALRTE